MTRRKIFLLTLIAALTLVYIFQILFSPKGEFQELSIKQSFDSVKIENSGNSITIKKTDSDYLINSEFPGKSEAAEYIFNSITSIKIIDTISKNPKDQDFERYGLVNPVRVTALEGSKKIRTLKIGKTSSTGNQTYIQLDDKKEIYLVSGNLNSSFNVTEDSLLDYVLYKINADEIYKIQVNYSTFGTFTAEKAGESADFKWNITQTDNDIDLEKFDSLKFQEWVNEITELKADKWISDFDPEDSTLDNSRYFSIIISAAGKDIKVELFTLKADAGSEKLCICSENEYLCTISAEAVHKLIPELSSFTE
ncbi:MAG: DUF4340 domain-containing protein [Treponema sp.]|nr:DUF4340 domain-containing protein [Treponema sp.]